MSSVKNKMLLMVGIICFFSPEISSQQANVPGDNTAAVSATTPRMLDGHPDFNGLWNVGYIQGLPAGYNINDLSRAASASAPSGLAPTVFPARQTDGRTGDSALINLERDNTLLRRMDANKPQYKPEYWETIKKLDQGGNNEDPGGNCMPPGVPRVGPPTLIMQSSKQMIFLYVPGGASGFAPTYRVIPIDGRNHSRLEDLDGTWNGESIGRWEGDTMVIDTIGFNTATWLDIEGYFHSENMHVIERLRRDRDTLTWQATVDDPDMLLTPWVMDAITVHLNPDPTAVLPEPTPCSERDYAHAVTKEHH